MGACSCTDVGTMRDGHEFVSLERSNRLNTLFTMLFGNLRKSEQTPVEGVVVAKGVRR